MICHKKLMFITLTNDSREKCNTSSLIKLKYADVRRVQNAAN